MRPRSFLALLLAPLLGCLSPGLEVRRELRLYELSGARLLWCELGGGRKQGARGLLRCSSPDGETFQGEWIRMKGSTRESSIGESDDMSTLPTLGSRITLSTWDWASSLGVDLEKNSQRCIFLLYGDRGTVIDGIVVGDSSGGEGLLGAAKDNKGRKYRVMG